METVPSPAPASAPLTPDDSDPLPAFPSFSDLSSLLPNSLPPSPTLAASGSTALRSSPVLRRERALGKVGADVVLRGSQGGPPSGGGKAEENVSDLDPFSKTFIPSVESNSVGRENATSGGIVEGTQRGTPPLRVVIPSASAKAQSSWTTLGATVQENSKLELISDDEDSAEEEGTKPSTEVESTRSGGSSPISPLKGLMGGIGRARNGISGPTGSGGATTGFLGSMFRSGSGQGTSSTDIPVQEEKQEVSSEKPLPKPSTSSSLGGTRVAVASTSSTPIHDAHARSPATGGLLNPLASISSIFRSAASSQNSSPTPNNRTIAAEITEKGKERMSERDRVEEREEVLFDFNKFLEQMRSRPADPIAKYLRSCLKEFSRRPPVSSGDQIRVINDFLDFIAGKMRTVDPWRAALVEGGPERGEAEFDMALEAMEKLVMNRVWHLTFTPAIDLSTLPQHVSPTDDLERDHVLAQRIRLFAWIQPCHLDLPIPSTAPPAESLPDPSQLPALPEAVEPPDLLQPTPPSSPRTVERRQADSKNRQKERQTIGFLDFARKELNKINQYKAPRDKLICVLNSCKVIFGLIRHVSTDEGADSFIPFLIYIVLKANPEHLVSNLQYIQRFRNPEKLSGEGGYYLSSLNGAISFIETMDASSLSNITQADFETNVAKAIESLHRNPQDPSNQLPPSPAIHRFPGTNAFGAPLQASPLSPSTRIRSSPAIVTQGNELTSSRLDELESPASLQRPELSFPDARAFFARSTDEVERIVSKPLGAIGRIFEQLEALTDNAPMVLGGEGPRDDAGGSPARPASLRSRSSYRAYQRPPPLNLSSHAQDPNNVLRDPTPASAGFQQSTFVQQRPRTRSRSGSSHSTAALEVERVTDEIDRQHELQRLASIDTLKSIFPGLEREVLEMVLLSNAGNMSTTIDSLLEMS